MQIEVVVEKIAGNGYRATTYTPFPASTHAPTSEQALSSLREVVRQKVASGAKVVLMDVPAPDHPLAAVAGWLKDDPMFDAWVRARKDNRRERAQAENPTSNDESQAG